MWSWLKWARRDRRLAFIMIIDGLLATLIIAVLVSFVWPSAPPTATLPGPGSPGPVVTALPAVGFGEDSPVPPVPTANPTRLAALPNQGQTDAPPSPPGLFDTKPGPPGNSSLQLPPLATSSSPTPTPAISPTRRP